jgi:hypothetical protein
MKGLETAASLATAFGSQATTAASKLADAADKQQATDDADKKLASIQTAKDKRFDVGRRRSAARQRGARTDER